MFLVSIYITSEPILGDDVIIRGWPHGRSGHRGEKTPAHARNTLTHSSAVQLVAYLLY
jgi:hypothetical protein